MNNVLARRYAKVLFKLSKHRKLSDVIKSDLETMAHLYSTHPKWYEILNSPRAQAHIKNKMISSLGKKRIIHGYVEALLLMLSQYSRMCLITPILKYYKQEIDSANDVCRVDVILSAEHLEKDLNDTISQAIKNILDKKVIINYSIDKTLIAGIVIKIDNRIIDGSIKKELEIIKKRLLKSSEEMFKFL